ncbi:MAG: hypothetical protein Q9167_007910 [Letrouitia subvulpina]
MAHSSQKPKLPVKQLAVLSLCRLADPISFSSVIPYLPEMIESFNVPKNDVAKWAGMTAAVFSISQAATGIFWGRASDRYGRKPAILTAMTCVMLSGLLFGFSQTLAMAIIARSCAGASNGNVGVLRTIVAEMVPHKELQPKAFSVMPLVWTIGSIFGPGFGGVLANPSKKYPRLFRSDFFRTFPYALPNIAQETLETKKDHEDIGRRLGKLVLRPFMRGEKEPRSPIDQEQASPLLKQSRLSSTSTIASQSSTPSATKSAASGAPSYRDLFTRSPTMPSSQSLCTTRHRKTELPTQKSTYLLSSLAVLVLT